MNQLDISNAVFNTADESLGGIMEKPILFSTQMVKAILSGRKTQTRRIVRKRDGYHRSELLWVRETWLQVPTSGEFCYKADGVFLDGALWRPSIYMPRRASRITLRVTDFRIERLQEITEDDAKAEGIIGFSDNLGSRHSNPTTIYPAFPDRPGGFPTARAAFEALWNSINAKRGFSWDINPYVSVITFEIERVTGSLHKHIEA
jgi:hypothetical protein